MSASSGRRKCTSRYRPRAAAASWPAICAAVRSSLADRGRAEGLYSLAQTGKGEGDTLTAQWPRFFWRSQAETARSAAQDSEAAWHQQAVDVALAAALRRGARYALHPRLGAQSSSRKIRSACAKNCRAASNCDPPHVSPRRCALKWVYQHLAAGIHVFHLSRSG